jgi:hypothetical protein
MKETQTPKMGAELLNRVGDMTPSRSSLVRLPKLVSGRWRYRWMLDERQSRAATSWRRCGHGPPPDRERLDERRARFDPAQFALIRAYVTLSREDEVTNWERLAARLDAPGRSRCIESASAHGPFPPRRSSNRSCDLPIAEADGRARIVFLDIHGYKRPRSNQTGVHHMKLGILFIAATLAPSLAHADTVLLRQRLGNNTEGMTYAPNGRYRGHALAIDGNDVIAISLQKPAGDSEGDRDDDEKADGDRGRARLRGPGWFSAFDVTRLPEQARTPRGIVYAPPSRQFFFTSKDTRDGSVLYSTDEAGTPLPPLHVNVANLDTWSNWEGAAYIPETAPLHPNTIAALGARNTDYFGHVYFIGLDGAVQTELVPEPGTPLENYLCGIAYKAPRSLLLSDCGTNVYEMDMGTGLQARDAAGNPATAFSVDTVDIESIVVPGDGRIFANGYQSGRLFGFKSDYSRDLSQDRSFVIGLGRSAGRVDWSAAAHRFVIQERATGTIYSTDLSTTTTLTSLEAMAGAANFNPAAADWVLLPGGKIAASSRGYPRGLATFDLASGALLNRLFFGCCRQTPDPFPAGRFNPVVLGVHGSDFIVGIRGDKQSLKIISSNGALDGGTGYTVPNLLGAIALSQPTMGSELRVLPDGRIFTGAEIYDASGALLHAIDPAELGITDHLFSGAFLGGNTFAVEDGDTSTVIVFSIP